MTRKSLPSMNSKSILQNSKSKESNSKKTIQGSTYLNPSHPTSLSSKPRKSLQPNHFQQNTSKFIKHEEMDETTEQFSNVMKNINENVVLGLFLPSQQKRKFELSYNFLVDIGKRAIRQNDTNQVMTHSFFQKYDDFKRDVVSYSKSSPFDRLHDFFDNQIAQIKTVIRLVNNTSRRINFTKLISELDGALNTYKTETSKTNEIDDAISKLNNELASSFPEQSPISLNAQEQLRLIQECISNYVQKEPNLKRAVSTMEKTENELFEVFNIPSDERGKYSHSARQSIKPKSSISKSYNHIHQISSKRPKSKTPPASVSNQRSPNSGANSTRNKSPSSVIEKAPYRFVNSNNKKVTGLPSRRKSYTPLSRNTKNLTTTDASKEKENTTSNLKTKKKVNQKVENNSEVKQSIEKSNQSNEPTKKPSLKSAANSQIRKKPQKQIRNQNQNQNIPKEKEEAEEKFNNNEYNFSQEQNNNDNQEISNSKIENENEEEDSKVENHGEKSRKPFEQLASHSDSDSYEEKTQQKLINQENQQQSRDLDLNSKSESDEEKPNQQSKFQNMRSKSDSNEEENLNKYENKSTDSDSEKDTKLPSQKYRNNLPDSDSEKDTKLPSQKYRNNLPDSDSEKDTKLPPQKYRNNLPDSDSERNTIPPPQKSKNNFSDSDSDIENNMSKQVPQKIQNKLNDSDPENIENPPQQKFKSTDSDSGSNEVNNKSTNSKFLNNNEQKPLRQFEQLASHSNSNTESNEEETQKKPANQILNTKSDESNEENPQKEPMNIQQSQQQKTNNKNEEEEIDFNYEYSQGSGNNQHRYNKNTNKVINSVNDSNDFNRKEAMIDGSDLSGSENEKENQTHLNSRDKNITNKTFVDSDSEPNQNQNKNQGNLSNSSYSPPYSSQQQKQQDLEGKQNDYKMNEFLQEEEEENIEQKEQKVENNQNKFDEDNEIQQSDQQRNLQRQEYLEEEQSKEFQNQQEQDEEEEFEQHRGIQNQQEQQESDEDEMAQQKQNFQQRKFQKRDFSDEEQNEHNEEEEFTQQRKMQNQQEQQNSDEDEITNQNQNVQQQGIFNNEQTNKEDENESEQQTQNKPEQHEIDNEQQQEQEEEIKKPIPKQQKKETQQKQKAKQQQTSTTKKLNTVKTNKRTISSSSRPTSNKQVTSRNSSPLHNSTTQAHSSNTKLYNSQGKTIRKPKTPQEMMAKSAQNKTKTTNISSTTSNKTSLTSTQKSNKTTATATNSKTRSKSLPNSVSNIGSYTKTKPKTNSKPTNKSGTTQRRLSQQPQKNYLESKTKRKSNLISASETKAKTKTTTTINSKTNMSKSTNAVQKEVNNKKQPKNPFHATELKQNNDNKKEITTNKSTIVTNNTTLRNKLKQQKQNNKNKNNEQQAKELARIKRENQNLRSQIEKIESDILDIDSELNRTPDVAITELQYEVEHLTKENNELSNLATFETASSVTTETIRAYEDYASSLKKGNQSRSLINNEIRQLIEKGTISQTVAFANPQLIDENKNLQREVEKTRSELEFNMKQRASILAPSSSPSPSSSPATSKSRSSKNKNSPKQINMSNDRIWSAYSLLMYENAFIKDELNFVESGIGEEKLLINKASIEPTFQTKIVNKSSSNNNNNNKNKQKNKKGNTLSNENAENPIDSIYKNKIKMLNKQIEELEEKIASVNDDVDLSYSEEIDSMNLSSEELPPFSQNISNRNAFNSLNSSKKSLLISRDTFDKNEKKFARLKEIRYLYYDKNVQKTDNDLALLEEEYSHLEAEINSGSNANQNGKEESADFVRIYEELDKINSDLLEARLEYKTSIDSFREAQENLADTESQLNEADLSLSILKTELKHKQKQEINFNLYNDGAKKLEQLFVARIGIASKLKLIEDSLDEKFRDIFDGQKINIMRKIELLRQKLLESKESNKEEKKKNDQFENKKPNPTLMKNNSNKRNKHSEYSTTSEEEIYSENENENENEIESKNSKNEKEFIKNNSMKNEKQRKQNIEDNDSSEKDFEDYTQLNANKNQNQNQKNKKLKRKIIDDFENESDDDNLRPKKNSFKFDDTDSESQNNHALNENSEKVVAPVKRLKIESDESTEDDIVFNSKPKNKQIMNNQKNYDDEIILDSENNEQLNIRPNVEKRSKRSIQNFDTSD